MGYVDYVYNFVERDCKSMDSIYEDYILHLVGISGLTVLLTNKLLETCGVVNGRQLYVLCKKGGDNV